MSVKLSKEAKAALDRGEAIALRVEIGFHIKVSRCSRRQRCSVKPCNVLMSKGEHSVEIASSFGLFGTARRGRAKKSPISNGMCLPCARETVLNFRKVGMVGDDGLSEIDCLISQKREVYVGRAVKE